MEKNQYKLCIEVLKRLEKADVLKDVILIGSWCIPFYKDYFGSVQYPTAIKTRDVDFLVPTPLKTKTKTDIPKLLKDLGFIVDFKGVEGYIQLEHSDLIIEFLSCTIVQRIANTLSRKTHQYTPFGFSNAHCCT